MLKDLLNILITGVGGQGNVTMARILATAAAFAGYDVLVGELYGSAQRGGSVTSHVRIGKKVLTPMIPKHSADAVIALEMNESLRVADYLKRNATIVLNEYMIYPPEVLRGEASYPSKDEIVSVLKGLTDKVYVVPATDIAIKQLGNAMVGNTILLGFFLSVFDTGINYEHVAEALKVTIKPKYLDLNLKALDVGRELAQKYA
ncbi:MAG: indolepyruvate oxidoreductase subunit beta [Staphylothermus sp.]|nr:indolepyruvate oxidoreductase subunit beta [Staphylothermus sp.]